MAAQEVAITDAAEIIVNTLDATIDGVY